MVRVLVSDHDGLGSIPVATSNIKKRVCMFFLTVYLAMSVRLDLFPSTGSFCDLAWGSLTVRISAFLVVIDIYWACCSKLTKMFVAHAMIDKPVTSSIWITRKHVPL